MANDIMNRPNDLRDWFDNDPWMNFSSMFRDNFPSNTNLKTDIKESDQSYEVHVDMPAFDKKNIDIDYQNDTLTISGHRDSFNDHNDKDGDMIMSERSSGRFMRQYHLPAVAADRIKANYADGVLQIELPKLADKKQLGHHIDID